MGTRGFPVGQPCLQHARLPAGSLLSPRHLRVLSGRGSHPLGRRTGRRTVTPCPAGTRESAPFFPFPARPASQTPAVGRPGWGGQGLTPCGPSLRVRLPAGAVARSRAAPENPRSPLVLLLAGDVRPEWTQVAQTGPGTCVGAAPTSAAVALPAGAPHAPAPARRGPSQRQIPCPAGGGLGSAGRAGAGRGASIRVPVRRAKHSRVPHPAVGHFPNVEAEVAMGRDARAWDAPGMVWPLGGRRSRAVDAARAGGTGLLATGTPRPLEAPFSSPGKEEGLRGTARPPRPGARATSSFFLEISFILILSPCPSRWGEPRLQLPLALPAPVPGLRQR